MAASGLHTPSGDYLHLSELRIVLLGYRVAGKTSSGNTILGREEFDLRTAVQCVKRQGEVAGRHLTVVDTPGWWANHPLENTHELLKQEIVLSVSLCPPGPHTFLLVIDVDDSFTEEYRRAVEEHLELLSEKVWSHTIVLFTHGDFLGDTAIDQHIEREGKALQWLVEKCGNRYHVFNNKNRGDSTQITELLNNIEETVAGNRGGHYEIKGEILLEIEEKRKAEEESAKQRLMKVQEQRKTLRSLMGDSLHLSELRIVLLGYRGGSGKSSAGNTILGREAFDLKTTAQCVKRQGEVAGRQVTVIDTPGWWKNLPVERTPELVKQEILLSVSLCPPGPHTFLLVISVGFLYTEEDRRAVEEHLTLLCETVWSHTIVLFTRGDCLGDTTIEQHIESEGEALKWLVDKCGNRYHILNNENRGDVTQVTELLEKIEEMVAGNRGGHFEIKRELLENIEVWRRKKEDKAKELCMRVKKQREIHRTFIGHSLHLSELRIVLLGSRDAGKSSAGNTILGREEFDLRTAAQCVKRHGEVAGRQVTVVDTPGWWKNLPVEYTPELVKQEIVFSASLCPPGPHTVFLVIRVDISFKEEETNAAEDHLELLSERVWSHTIVLFTHGDCLGDTTIEHHIQREGKALQWLVEKCGNRFHVLNNNNSGDATQVTELLEKIDELVAANSGDVFYPERDCKEGMNLIPEEMFEKPSLPLKGAHSIYPLLLSMSGGSRPETGYDGSDQMSGIGSVAESLLRLVVPGDDISDTQSLRSSVYSSQTSEPVCEHNSGSKSSREKSSLDVMSFVLRRIFCSQKNPCTSDASNHESEHRSTSTSVERTLAVVTKLTPETSTGFTETSCRLQCSHAGLFQCSLTGLVFLMKREGEVLYRTVQWDENLLHSTGQIPAGPLFSIECLQGSVCQLHLPHCEILSGEGLDSLSVAHVTGDSVEVLPPLRVTDTHVVVNIIDLSLWGLVRMFRPFLSIKGQVLPFLQSFGHPQSVLNVIVLPSNVPLNEVKQQQTGNTYIPVCSDCTLSRGEKYSLSCDLKKIQDIYPKAKRIQIYWDYGPNYHPTFQVFLNPDTEHVELRLLERGADGDEVWAGRVLLPGAVLVGRDQAENSHSDPAEKQLHSVRKDFVDRVSKSVVDDLLDGLLQQKVINNHEMETVKVIPERAEKAREVIDMVLRKGDVSCLIMKTLLIELDPFLCKMLGFH